MILYLFAALVGLQVPQRNVTPGDRFTWEAVGPLPLIESYRYEVEIDGQIRRDPLGDVQCEALKDVVRCSAAYPSSTLGGHLMRVRPVDVSVPGLPAVEGDWMPYVYYVMRSKPPAMKPTEVKPKGPA